MDAWRNATQTRVGGLNSYAWLDLETYVLLIVCHNALYQKAVRQTYAKSTYCCWGALIFYKVSLEYL